MAHTLQLTTDQANFCRAVEAMKLDLLRNGKEAHWLVAHPGLLALVWGVAAGEVCGLRVVETAGCPPGSFHVSSRRPEGG